MICVKCNKQIDDDSKFCSFCGNKIQEIENKNFSDNELIVNKIDENILQQKENKKFDNKKNADGLKQTSFYQFFLDHKGSIGRKEFFFRGFLPLTIINLILLTIFKISNIFTEYNSSYSFLIYTAFIVSIFIFVIISNITVKRLHDMNSKSWFFIWNLVPFLNIILLLSLLSTPSSKIRNHGETDYYELTSSKILFSILNVCIIAILVVVFSLVNVLFKSHIEKNYLNSNNQIFLKDEALYPWKDSKTQKFGYVSSKGNWIIEPKFNIAALFSEDLALVKIDNKYGFIDRKGNFVIKPIFDAMTSSFSEGLAKVCINLKCGFINKKGEWEIQPIYHFTLSSKFIEEMAAAKINEKYGFIDKKGNWIIEPKFDGATGFSEGLASVSINDLNGFIDKKGDWVFPPIFSSASNFSEGLANVIINDTSGYIDKKGNFIFKNNYDYSAEFSEGLARFKINNKWGFIDQNGNIAISPIFDYASDFVEGISRVTINDKVGFINKKGEFVISPIYDDASKHIYKGFIGAIKDNKELLIDKNGKIIVISD